MSIKSNEEINEKLMDNKMLLRIKENVVREYYERINKSSKQDKYLEDEFQTRFKRIIGEKISRKRLSRSKKSRTKKNKLKNT